MLFSHVDGTLFMSYQVLVVAASGLEFCVESDLEICKILKFLCSITGIRKYLEIYLMNPVNL